MEVICICLLIIFTLQVILATRRLLQLQLSFFSSNIVADQFPPLS